MTGQIRTGDRYGVYMTLSVRRSVRALSINKDEKKRFSLVPCNARHPLKKRAGIVRLKGVYKQ